MKKKVDFIPIDPNLKMWLLEKIIKEPPKSEYTEVFLEGIKNLVSGEVETIILGNPENVNMVEEFISDCIKVKDLQVFPKSRKVLLNNEEVNLTPKEFDILYFLIKNPGQVFTKEQIYRSVWADDYLLDDSNIMAFIRKLRKKIEPNPDAPVYILTIWGIGYKFNDEL